MGGPSSSDQRGDESERTPLLPDAERQQNESSKTPLKKAARWTARNAVIICMSLLVLAAIVIICVFFGGK
jgi:endothelin-converting enzyme